MLCRKESTSVAILCTVSFIQSYLLVNIFPYQAYMSVYLWNRQHPEKAITVEQAGPCAAFLTTSFMIGRTLTAHYWGRIADIYGRRLVLIATLIGSGWACLWFGMTSRYGGWFGAVAARGVIGGWNSIVGVIKTLATELAYYNYDSGHRCGAQISDETEQCDDTQVSAHDENTLSHNLHVNQNNQHLCDEQKKRETRIVGLVMSMRAWGFLGAPAIAGYLADPLMVREHENGTATSSNMFVVQILQSYPYLLPNLVGALLCWIAAAAVFLVIPETLEECTSLCSIVREYWDQNTCKKRSRLKMRQPTVYTDSTYGSLADDANKNTGQNKRICEETTNATSISSIWSRRSTRRHLMAYWLYSFVIMCIDEAFPLYCISRNNGLGQLSEYDIGTILSIAGLIFAMGQYHVYLYIVDRLGVYGSLSFGCWWGVLPVSFIPAAALIASFSDRYFFKMMYIALLVGLTKIFQSAFFSGITMATNWTVPKEMRSSMNGFGGMGAGGAKALGPLLAGYWMSICLSWDRDGKIYGSCIAFLGLGSLSVPLIVYLHFLERSENES
ncbi:hypothetical protein HJC23_012756 [Cyclotella cryptica]|uniref:Major facilitator superfamily (MFS) profile domain-containing protein n=1 Tax=Cyclotella cryptica TaxID=29204 RepID=A0ABD3Q5F2_9STRA|eukprot:CCRYP_008970-RA/>CCRYP_008970-RA protein AED:0.01 eAED:0.00 QI:0/-1/0/1/-1/1/1/0/555